MKKNNAIRLLGSIDPHKLDDAQLVAEFDKITSQVEDWGLIVTLCAIGRLFDNRGFTQQGTMVLLIVDELNRLACKQITEKQNKVSGLN